MPLLEPGQQLGRWTVVRFIDEGGNGEVWEVTEPEGKPAALKILRDHRVRSVAYQRFRREIETVQGLGERPGVLPVVDSHLPEAPSKRNRAWYVMPVARPLEAELAGRPVADVVRAAAFLAGVLADLHSEDVCHRDIKPANLLHDAGVPVIGDFGLVSIPDAESLTEPGRVPGAFGYIADEVMMNPNEGARPPADVFALAKVLWKLLTPGAAFPPQGPLRADNGPSTLARSLTVPRADALDRILEAATRAADSRLSMAEFAGELCSWLELPAPTDLPDGLEAALLLARHSMETAIRERDLAAARERSVSQGEQLLVSCSEDLFEAIRVLDPAGVEIGRMAVGDLYRILEETPAAGRPNYGAAFHHGVRIERSRHARRDDVLLVAFCLQVADDGQGRVRGLLLAGDEKTQDSMFCHLQPRRARLGIDLEAAIEGIVSEAASKLGPVLEEFARRAEEG